VRYELVGKREVEGVECPGRREVLVLEAKG
jgi:hypothetical protein